MRITIRASLLSALLSTLVATAAFAKDRGTLWAEPLGKVRVDGVMREWHTKLTRLDQTLMGKVRSEPKAEGAVGYDDDYLYVAMDIVDDKLVRSRGAGRGEDHGILMLAFPSGTKGYATHRVDLYPGDPGRLPGVVKVDGRSVRGTKLVEAPADDGLTFEARIPWSAFPEARRVRTGLRGSLQYVDADRSGATRAVIASAKGKRGRALPALMTESEQGLYSNLLREKGLGTTPSKEVTGDVAGDGMLEQVAIYGPFLTIVGGGYRGGKEFYFSDLQVRDASMVTRLGLHDFDGDGKQEIITIRRIGSKKRFREVLQIFKLDESGAPFAALTHEVGITNGGKSMRNEVEVSGGGKAARVTIAADEVNGFDEESFDEAKPADMPASLLPWERVVERTYRWQGGGFEETEQKTREGAERSEASAGTSISASGPLSPRPPSPDQLMDQVYSLYRKDRGVGREEPRFDFVTNVAGDETPERVLVHGRDLVIFGKHFLSGTSYTYTTLGVEEPADIIDVTARDLTGDGTAEILIRAIMRAKSSEELGGEVVSRYAFVAYKVKGDRIGRVFAAETGRALGADRILGAIAFLPSHAGGVRIELRPGRALGWTQESYPFPEDRSASGGLEPLLLPWRMGVQRYHFDGTEFRP